MLKNDNMDNFGKTYGYNKGTIDLTTASMPGAATAKALRVFFASSAWGLFLPYSRPGSPDFTEPEITMPAEPAGTPEDLADQNPPPSKALGMVHHLRHTKR